MQNKNPDAPRRTPERATRAAARAKTSSTKQAVAARSRAPQAPRQIHAALLAAIDIVLIAISLVVFALFDHVIPVNLEDTVQDSYAFSTNAQASLEDDTLSFGTGETSQNDDALPFDVGQMFQTDAEAPESAPASTPPEDSQLTLPAADEAEDESASLPEETAAPATPEPVLAVGDFSAKFADKFTDGEVIQTDTTYQSANLNITMKTFNFNLGSYKEVLFVQDIYVRNIQCIRRCFAKDTYGKAITESVKSMADRSHAVCAINGDYYGHNNSGIVIRDGVMYRDRFSADMQTIVLFKDGTIRCYQKASQFNAKQVMADGAWQSFSFGPVLVYGGSKDPKGYEHVFHDPRTIIGMVEPGHYMFIVVDGRRSTYSEGFTHAESATICQKLGLTTAFNLDGGRTSQMYMMGKIVNKPYKKGRDLSDIVYIIEP